MTSLLYAATCPTCNEPARIFIGRGILECLDCAK